VDSQHGASSYRLFQTRWQADAEDVMADATRKPSEMPSHCKLAVIGAGWGGAYMA